MERIITITTGTRADYGIIRPVLKKIEKSSKLKLILIVTGMHLSKKHGKTIEEIKKDGFKISKIINMFPKKDTNFEMSMSIGKGVKEFSEVFKVFKPHVNLILGDRDEMLASAIAAYHMNIPNAHIHGGDKSKGGIDEYNRHAITKMSNIHFAASKKSFDRIIKMGENPKFVFLTGSPSIDEIKEKRITSKKELEKKYYLKIKGDEILLLQHPVTTESEQSMEQIIEILNALSKIKKQVIAIMPNSDAGSSHIIENLKKYSKEFRFIKTYTTLPREDFLGFLKYSKILLGNSSGGMIEASYFDTFIINVGIRQEGRERGLNVADVRPLKNEIYNEILKCLKKKRRKSNKKIYGNGTASKRIIKILETVRLNKELIRKQIYY